MLFAAAHFPHESGMPVTLQIPDKSEEWHPRFYMEKGERMLAGDWLGFVCDNNVQVGDMCIFVPCQRKSRISRLIFFKMDGLIASASKICTGMEERTWRVRASHWSRDSREAFHVASFLESLSTSGRSA